jgi:hypothetical protein
MERRIKTETRISFEMYTNSTYIYYLEMYYSCMFFLKVGWKSSSFFLQCQNYSQALICFDFEKNE